MGAWPILLIGFSYFCSQTPRPHPLGLSKVGPYEAEPGVTAPKVIHKVDPEYSGEARRARVQGVVLYRIVVDESGQPVDIHVLSPIGFGLDERGEAAIAKWKFKPGRKDGVPVSVRATVEVDFRLARRYFDEKSEHRRLTFNVALGNVNSADATENARGVRDLQLLAAEDYAPAMGVLGRMMFYADKVPKDPEAGFALIQRAADQNYGPALYLLGLAHMKGTPLPLDTGKGLQLMRDAAILGSPQAQFYLGVRYEKGEGVERDLDRARRYFRLCATAGVDLCQLHMGILTRDTDPIQALAWLHLAESKGSSEAVQLAAPLRASLTPDQIDKANRMEAQMSRKPLFGN